MSRFLEALHSGRVLLMDGAMGTELQRAGIGEGECYELWNLTHPNKVRAIHNAYVDAGTEVLLSNTFQANPVAFGKHGVESQLENIQEAALALARSTIETNGFVLLDIGPIPVEFRTARPRTKVKQWLSRVVRTSGDADGLILETYSGWMVQTALEYVHELRGEFKHARQLPVLLSMTYEHPSAQFHCTFDSQEPEAFAALKRFAPDCLGVNCGRDIGMDEIIEIVRRYRQVTDLPLFARPNAGTPKRVGNRWVYPLTPEKMAERLPELLEAGVSMVGGCCGTTPEHIAAMKPVVDKWNARHI